MRARYGALENYLLNLVNRPPEPSTELASVPQLFIDSETGVIVPPSDDPLVIRAWIRTITDYLLGLPKVDQRDFEVEHSFLDGMYSRKLFIPKGSILIGKIHKLPCLNIVAKGDISVLTETGSARIKAGYTVTSPAGIQKLGIAHEDTIFINVFRTDETDIDKIEEAVAWANYEALQSDPTLKIEGVSVCL